MASTDDSVQKLLLLHVGAGTEVHSCIHTPSEHIIEKVREGEQSKCADLGRSSSGPPLSYSVRCSQRPQMLEAVLS